MPSIHRTSYSTTQIPPPECFAEQIAGLIDGQARTGVAITGGRERQAEPPATNALIWIEGDQALADARQRGLLVVGHGACQALKEWSCVISYPTGATERGQRLLEVSESLAGMGWLLLSRRRPVTTAGDASIAVLVNRELPGQERRLWLAALSVAQAEDGPIAERVLPGDADHGPVPSGRPGPPHAGPATAPGTRDQVETWVNEGGAGDDVSG